MLNSEVRQLELLASIDDLRCRVRAWSDRPEDWPPAQRCQGLLRRVVDRVETLRVRMEAPLVVATFGGTGTGKSTLVNALIGEEVTRSGKQRPTTHHPVLIAHSRTDLTETGMPLEEVEIVQRDADLLRDVVLLDCPDPDTTEGGAPGSNLDRLRSLLPYCDVLLYVSTQQKYRSARVADELRSAASGCRLIFVQTHAELDSDIRDDWQRTLAEDYEAPEMFFVDSLKGLREQLAGQRPTRELGRLLDLLRNKLSASDRVRIRRANVLDLLQAGLERCGEILDEQQPALRDLHAALTAQRQRLSRRMAEQLQTELLASRSLWERRLTAGVIDRWGVSPFSAVLRVYHGLGGLIASTILFRARSAAQLALLGTVQSVRWWEGRRREQAAETSLQRISQLGLGDALLREAEIVIAGYAAAAGVACGQGRGETLESLRNRAADVEAEFVGDASQRVESIIHDLSQTNARWSIRWSYELLLTAYLGFVLYRVGKNFFYDSFVLDKSLLSTDFYLAAGLFLAILCGVLIMAFVRRLQRGLGRRIQTLSGELAEARLAGGLFPDLEQALRGAQGRRDEVVQLLSQTENLRHELAGAEHLGGRQFRKAQPLRAPAL